MATAVAAKSPKDFIFEWEGKDKNGKSVRGEMRAGGEAMVSASLRRQGVMVNKVKKRRMSGGRDRSIETKALALDDAVPIRQRLLVRARVEGFRGENREALARIDRYWRSWRDPRREFFSPGTAGRKRGWILVVLHRRSAGNFL